MDLSALLSADGVALVGASEERHYPRSILLNLLGLGYPPERIFPVNPRYSSVLGLACFPSLEELPGPASLVVVATQRDTVPSMLRAAAAVGARSAVVLADGFAEQGAEGKARQDEVAALCSSLGLALLGPNTLGFIAPARGVGVWAGGELPARLRAGGLAIVSQSSGTLNLLLAQAGHRHLGLSAAVSVGNEAVLGAADFISYLAADSDTRVIACFLETTTRPAALVRSLELARSAGKPVVMLKIGRSERARRNAVAHTGRLATSGAAWEALLRRLGVVLVDDLDQLLETSSLFVHTRSRSGSGGLGVATISGGDCGLIADMCERLGVPLPEVGPKTHEALVRALEKSSLVGNPLDCENLRREDRTRFDAAVAAFCAESRFELVAFRMNLDPEPSEGLRDLYTALLGSADAAGRMAVVLSRSAEPLGSAWFEFFESLEVAFLPTYASSLASIGHFLRGVGGSGAAGLSVPESTSEAEVAGRLLGWSETQAWLGEVGIPYVASRLAEGASEAAQVAGELGFPVALKAVVPGVAHKSESGGVRLGLISAEEVVAAASSMNGVSSFEVQAMAGRGVEMILGMSRDPAVGPVVLVGMGGVLAELTADVRLAVPPLGEDEALSLIEGLRGAALLRGYRGSVGVDVEAFAGLVARFSRFVVEQGGDLLEVDLNPVVVLPEGAVAVDAVVRVRDGA